MLFLLIFQKFEKFPGTNFGVEILIERFQPNDHSRHRQFWKSSPGKAQKGQKEDPIRPKNPQEDRNYPVEAGGPREDGMQSSPNDEPSLHHQAKRQF